MQSHLSYSHSLIHIPLHYTHTHFTTLIIVRLVGVSTPPILLLFELQHLSVLCIVNPLIDGLSLRDCDLPQSCISFTYSHHHNHQLLYNNNNMTADTEINSKSEQVYMIDSPQSSSSVAVIVNAVDASLMSEFPSLSADLTMLPNSISDSDSSPSTSTKELTVDLASTDFASSSSNPNSPTSNFPSSPSAAADVALVVTTTTTTNTNSASAAAPSSSSRIGSLDGLRGIAALIVMLSHSLSVFPVLSDAYTFPHPHHPRHIHWLAYLITYTPFHIIWAGGEAVKLFFILSGFVLALPTANGRSTNWYAYYPQRIVRLYIPILSAQVLTYASLFIVRRGPDPEMSGFMSDHASEFTVSEIMSGAFAVAGTNVLNRVYWSLQWEIFFSILLPLYLWLLVQHRPWRWIKLTVMALLIIASDPFPNPADNSYINIPSLFLQLPTFGLGVWMAQQRPMLRASFARLDRQPGWVHGLLLTTLICVMLIPWYISGYNIQVRYDFVCQLPTLMVILGWCAFTQRGQSLGDIRVVAWLGSRSFSIYLLHDPVIATIAYALHTTNGVLVTVIAVPVALIIAEIFYRLIEQRAHQFARWVQQAITARTSPRKQPQPVKAVSIEEGAVEIQSLRPFIAETNDRASLKLSQ